MVILDCVYPLRSCNVTDLDRVNLVQEQVAATLLDPRNMTDRNVMTKKRSRLTCDNMEELVYVHVSRVTTWRS